jgi:hypothetical protein
MRPLALTIFTVCIAIRRSSECWSRTIRSPACSTRRSTPGFGLGAIGLGAVLIFTDVLPLSGAGTGAGVAAAGVTVLATVAYSVWELRRADKAEEGKGAE